MRRFMRSPPGRYSMTKYRFSGSWKEHFNPTIHGFFSEMARTFLSSLDWIILFLKIISDFFNFLTATGSLFLVHLQSLTSPKAPLPIILTEGKSLMDNFSRSLLRISASSWRTLFLSYSCSLRGMLSISIFLLSFSQYSFFYCSCCRSLEYLCSM